MAVELLFATDSEDSQISKFKESILKSKSIIFLSAEIAS